MIKVTVAYNDHLVDVHFPCSETTLYAVLTEIHAADDNPPKLFIKDVVFPEELDCLKDRFVNLDELNYLAKRMESFFGTEEEQFYEAMKQEGFTIPYEIRQHVGFSYNDVLSFTEADDGRTVTVKREKICDNCRGAKPAVVKDDEVTLFDFLCGYGNHKEHPAFARLL